VFLVLGGGGGAGSKNWSTGAREKHRKNILQLFPSILLHFQLDSREPQDQILRDLFVPEIAWRDVGTACLIKATCSHPYLGP
jgi:hypothetical protein